MLQGAILNHNNIHTKYHSIIKSAQLKKRSNANTKKRQELKVFGSHLQTSPCWLLIFIPLRSICKVIFNQQSTASCKLFGASLLWVALYYIYIQAIAWGHNALRLRITIYPLSKIILRTYQ